MEGKALGTTEAEIGQWRRAYEDCARVCDTLADQYRQAREELYYMMQCSVPDIMEAIARSGGGWEALDRLSLAELRQKYDQRTQQLFRNVRTALARIDEGGPQRIDVFNARLERILQDASKPEDTARMREQKAQIDTLTRQVTTLTTQAADLEARNQALYSENQGLRRDAQLSAARADKLEAQHQNDVDTLERLKAQIKTLQLQYETLQQQLTWAWTMIRQPGNDISFPPPEGITTGTPEPAASIPARPQGSPPPPHDLDETIPSPEIRTWYNSDTFQRDLPILQVLGDTGEPLRSIVDQRAQAASGFSASQMYRAFGTLRKAGLLRMPRAAIGERPYYLVGLTELGQAAYRWYFRREPVPQESDKLLALHQNAHHAFLILETECQLKAAGFEVIRYPVPLQVEGLGEYRPDLEAVYDGQRLYVEAERGTYKNPQDRVLKWQKAVKAGHGELWISVPRKHEGERVLSDVRKHVGASVKIHLLVVEDYIVGRTVPTGLRVWRD